MKEVNILFEILRLEICGMGSGELLKETVKAEDLTELWTLAKKHDLAPIVGHCLGKLGVLSDDDLGREMKQVPMMAVYRYMQQERALKSACQALEAAEVDHIPLKGAVIRKYYPLPWMRTGCDIDILVKPENLDAAIDALVTKCSYKLQAKNSHDVSLDSPGGTHIELHYDLIEDYVHGKDTVLERFWSSATPAEGKPIAF